MEAKTISKNEVIIKARRVWELWTTMWNGHLQKADWIIAADFQLHILSDQLVAEKEICNAEKVKYWVGLVRERFDTLQYKTDVGPFVDVDQQTLCCHWKATGIYNGKSGYPQDVPGTHFLIEGTDILKIREDRIYACWTQSNVVMKKRK